MNGTDELRAWWVRKFPVMDKELHKDFTAIADRIDAEHERVRAESILDMTDERMAEHGWIRLPVDADGVPIHVGDVMKWVRYEDDDPTIVRKVSAVGADVFFAWSYEQGRYAQYEAHAYRHHHEPTVEDVLREFALKAAGRECMTMRNDLVDEYAAKLRLAEGEDA